ncbi:MAG: hypothetical protein M3N24_06650 [Actinomycetota bacterium]|nr:hypothetical protein [Actinomycetota bacterium]
MAVFFLLPYFRRDLRYPLGWDSPFYIWRSQLVPLVGLDQNGVVRSGSPLLLAVLSRLTGQSAWTLVAVVPAILAGVASLGGAAMARVALGLPVRWIPVIGIVMWLGFGYAGMVWEQFDNVHNAALVLAGFAAALCAVAAGRGSLGAGILFLAAGLAHWQFYLFAMAIFVVAVLLWAWREVDTSGADRKLFGRMGSLLAAAGGSAALVGVGFMLTPFSPLVGPRFAGLGDLLRERFLRRAAEPGRYLAVPLAVGGAVLTYRSSSPSSARPARNLFLWLAAVWAGLTVLGAVAQAFGAPTAGLRLLHYFFPMTILAGVFVWNASEQAARGASSRDATIVTAALVVVVLGAFGTFAVSQQYRVRSWVEVEAVQQAVTAADYTGSEVPARQRVSYIVESRDSLTFARWRNTILSSIPPSEAIRSDVTQVDRGASLDVHAGAVIAIAQYAPRTIRDAARQQRGTFVGNGVVVLRGPSFPSVIKTPPSPDVATSAALPVAGLIAVLFFLSGAGWAWVLLPPDAPSRILLSPAFGIAALVLATLVWERLGLSLAGWMIAVPGAVAAGAGWVLAAVRR